MIARGIRRVYRSACERMNSKAERLTDENAEAIIIQKAKGMEETWRLER